MIGLSLTEARCPRAKGGALPHGGSTAKGAEGSRQLSMKGGDIFHSSSISSSYKRRP